MPGYMKYSSHPLAIIWHIIAAVIIAAIPGQIIYGGSIWQLSGNELTFVIGLSVSYISTALIISLMTLRLGRVRLLDCLIIFFAVFGCYFLWLLVTKSYYNRPLLLSSLFLSIIFILVPLVINRKALTAALGTAIVSLLAMQSMEGIPKQLLVKAFDKGVKPSRSEKLIDTAFYSIKATRFSHYFDVCDKVGKPCRGPRNGGGIATFGKGYLVANGEGGIYYFELAEDGKTLNKKNLPYSIPINSNKFIEDGNKASVWLFRVTDIMVRENGDDFQLYAAHHYWKSDKSCFVMRVSRAEGRIGEFLSGKADIQWKTIFETTPCLKVGKPLKRSHSKNLFSGDESGGRLALVGKQKLLLTVGDHLFTGYDRKEMLAQDPLSTYGKTVLIDPESGAWRIFTMGHRNPQGLYVDPQGNIWSTEHGPRGGDELNLLLDQKNYGWPLVTYGTDYHKKYWPLNKHQGQHLGYQRPIYSWVPSIATSNLIGVEKDLFKLWKGDLLVSSLKAKSLVRVRLREGRVVYAEPIQIDTKNSRIRDLLEDDKGRIVLWIDGGYIVFLEPMDNKHATLKGEIVSEDMRSQLLFGQCVGCHQVKDGKTHGIGPDLFGLFERGVAGAQGYAYSSAMLNLSGSWTEERLDKFLSDPSGFAPGTKMEFKGIPSKSDRSTIIRYLKRVTQ